MGWKRKRKRRFYISDLLGISINHWEEISVKQNNRKLILKREIKILHCTGKSWVKSIVKKIAGQFCMKFKHQIEWQYPFSSRAIRSKLASEGYKPGTAKQSEVWLLLKPCLYFLIKSWDWEKPKSVSASSNLIGCRWKIAWSSNLTQSKSFSFLMIFTPRSITKSWITVLLF